MEAVPNTNTFLSPFPSCVRTPGFISPFVFDEACALFNKKVEACISLYNNVLIIFYTGTTVRKQQQKNLPVSITSEGLEPFSAFLTSSTLQGML